jgi:hypothetical protein
MTLVATTSVEYAGDTQVATDTRTTLEQNVPQTFYALDVEVDFGDGSDVARTTVLGQPWVLSTSRILTAFGGSTSDHDPEDALIDGLRVIAGNFVAGVGFDVIAHAPNGASGKFNVHVIGA